MANDKGQKGAPGHGTTVIDDVLKPYAERFITGTMDWLASHEPIEAMLRDLSPTMRQVTNVLPGIAGFATAKLPDSMFKSPELAHFVRDMIVEAIKHIDEIVDEKGKASPEAYGKALSDARKAVMERKLLVDPMGHLHLPDCPSVAAFKRPQQHNGNNRNQPPPPQSHGLPEITVEQAIVQKRKASPCCFPAIQADLQKPSAPPKSDRKSPIEVVESSKDEALKKEFYSWLNGLTKAKRLRALDVLRELTSLEELVGFMKMSPKIRLEMLDLLEERNMRHVVRRYLATAGALAKLGFAKGLETLKGQWQQFKAWDESLAPRVAQERQKLQERRERRVQGKDKPPFWRMFLPF